MSKIQNEDIKSSAELIAQGGTAAQLPNDTKVYVTANGINKTLNQAITDGEIGGGGGAKNYISKYAASLGGGAVNPGNGDFEANATTGWSLFNTTLTSLVPTGSITAGAASITTFAATASNVLQKKYSLNVASSGAITAGHGFLSDAFYIDRQDQAKILQIGFSYKIVSGGTNINQSKTSANTFHVYMYDVTNSAWIQPIGVYNMDGSGKFVGSFQATSNSTQYRLAVICCNASSGASEINWDDFTCGPLAASAGNGVVAARMTSSATTSFVNGVATKTIWNAVSFDKTSGVADATNSRMNITSAGDYKVEMNMFFSAVAALANGAIQIYAYVNGANVATLGSTAIVNGSNTYRDVSASGILPNLKAGDYVEFYMSQDCGNTMSSLGAINQFTISKIMDASAIGAGSVIAATAKKTSGAHTATGSWQAIQSWTGISDSTGSFNASTGTYTATVSGKFQVKASIVWDINSTGNRGLRLRKNSGDTGIGGIYPAISTNPTAITISGDLDLIVGDTLTIEGYQTSGGSLNYFNSADACTFLSISKLSTDAALSLQTVSMSATRSTAQSISDATSATLIFPTVLWDDLGNYNSATGEYTVTKPGKYRVKAAWLFDVTTYADSAQARLSVYKNGVEQKVMYRMQGAGTSVYRDLTGDSAVKCVYGDVLTVRIFNGTGSSKSNLADATYNYLEVERIGD